MSAESPKRRVNPDDPVAARIREIRVRILHKAQDELADEFGVSKALVSGWETGRYRPSYEALERLKKASNLTIDYIVSGDEMVYRDVGGERPVLQAADAQTYFANDGLDFDRERAANLPKSIRAKISGYIAGAIEVYENSKPKRRFTRQENRMRGRLTGEVQRGGKKK